MPFTTMEKIREEGKLVYLFVLGDYENQEFVVRHVKVGVQLYFQLEISSKQLNVHV